MSFQYHIFCFFHCQFQYCHLIIYIFIFNIIINYFISLISDFIFIIIIFTSPLLPLLITLHFSFFIIIGYQYMPPSMSIISWLIRFFIISLPLIISFRYVIFHAIIYYYYSLMPSLLPFISATPLFHFSHFAMISLSFIFLTPHASSFHLSPCRHCHLLIWYHWVVDVIFIITHHAAIDYAIDWIIGFITAWLRYHCFHLSLISVVSHYDMLNISLRHIAIIEAYR